MKSSRKHFTEFIIPQKCKRNQKLARLGKYIVNNVKMGAQMHVSLSVGTWGANGNPNPCTDLDEIPTCLRKVLAQV